MSKKLATTPPSAVSLPFDYGEDAGVGMDITMDDLKLPLLILAQTESKILIDGEKKFVPGGAPGDILNSATKEYYKEGILLVPAVKKQSTIEWLPKNQGFVAEHAVGAAITKKSADNELANTQTLIAVRVDENLNPLEFVVIPFSSSKLAAWSDYWTKINTAKITKSAPIFANVIRVVSFDDKNSDGKRYKNYKMFPAFDESGKLTLDVDVGAPVTSMIGPDSPAFLAAKQLRDQVLAGKAQVDHAEDTHF